MRFVRILLVIIAVACFGVALSYPIRYHLAQKSNDSNMEQLAEMRSRVREETGEAPEAPGAKPDVPDSGEGEDGSTEKAGAASVPEDRATEGSEAADTGAEVKSAPEGADETVADPSDPEDQLPRFPTKPTLQPETAAPEASAEQSVGEAMPVPEAGDDWTAEGQSSDAAESATTSVGQAAPGPTPTPEPMPTPDPYYWDLSHYLEATATPTPKPTDGPSPTPTPLPTPTPDRSIRTGPLPYTMKDKVVLDEAAMLPELKDIYALNRDLVGWVTIPDTVIDYPVVQCDDPDFYLSHDFYGEENINGQIILDPLCDPYTPSYNLILSGHHMKNGSMFGNLPEYRSKGYWERHRFLEFDSLMERKQYVIFAAFYSADYDEDEEGFRYNANLVYKIDVERWLEEIAENQLYDTGVEAEFGDEFITLTTCNRARHRNGRFVVVCRRIREGETFE